MLTRLSDLVADSTLAELVAEFVAVVGQPEFPCTFATKALARDELFFTAVTPDADPRVGTALVLRELAGALVDEPDAVAVLFLPGTASLAEDRRFVRDLIGYLCEHDGIGWPVGEPMDPEDPVWMLWNAGVGLFLNVSSGHHLRRRSRNLGSSLTFIAQARSSFDRYAGDGAMRARIRARVAAYDEVPVHPALGCYGSDRNRESHQYFLGDGSEDEPLLTMADVVDAVCRGRTARRDA